MTVISTPVTSTVRSADGTSIAFEVHGRPDHPAVLHVHGACTYRAMQPAPAQIAELVAARVLAYDRRGRGKSGNTDPYAVEREVEDIAALIEHLGSPVVLVGESSGAVLALEAAMAGLAVSAVIAYEPPFVVDAGRAPVGPHFAERLESLVQAGRGEDALVLFTVEGVGLPEEMAAGMREMPHWPVVVPLAPTVVHDALVMRDTMSGRVEPLQRYSDVAVPVRMLVGSETFPFVHAAAEALAAVVVDAQVVHLPGADHQLQAAHVAPTLRSVLDDLGGVR